MDEDLRALLARLTDYSEQNNSAIQKLANDLEQIRDARYKPYITTMGAFLALFVTAVGYIYNVEQRLVDGSFAIQKEIQALAARNVINANRIQTLDSRLAARTNTMALRWEAHGAVHKDSDVDRRLLAQELLEIIKTLKEEKRLEE